jgi:sporulation protein YlmC with PRC-barrel domain
MIDQGSVPSLMGSTVRDSSGDKIGKVGQVYLDDTTGLPEWVTVRTGLFGTRESFVPLAAARVEGDELVVDVAKDRVTDAPKIDEDGHLSEAQEAELYSYYGVSPGAFGREAGPTDGYGTADYTSEATTDASYAQPAAPYAPTGGRDADAGADGGADGGADLTAGREASGFGTDDAMARPDEQPRADTEPPAAARARLRRYQAEPTAPAPQPAPPAERSGPSAAPDPEAR